MHERHTPIVDRAHEKRLLGLAYRLLGSYADAQDMVQDAYLRLHQAATPPDSVEAYLYRVVSNLCIDRLRRLKVERKSYFGPWLPDPIADDDIDVLERKDDLSMAFMLVLEKLSPAERVVYVLRQAYDFSFAEIAELLEISVDSARQRAHRAAKRLQGIELEDSLSYQQQAELLTTLSAKLVQADITGLVKMLAVDVVALTDGGGVASAAVRPVEGAERVAQVFTFLTNKPGNAENFEYHFMRVNGGCAVVILEHGEIHSCNQVTVKNGLIDFVFVTRNPHKLKQLVASLT